MQTELERPALLASLVRKLGRSMKERLFPSPPPVVRAVAPFTMLTPKRLNSLLKLGREITQKGVSGDFVECGTCRGGSGAILAWGVKEDGWKRDLYLFDSFQGHPSSATKEAPDRDEVAKWAGTMVASQEDVVLALKSVDAYNPAHIKIVPGWFQESVPTAGILRIALLHLDGDWYDSIRFCLEALYDKVNSGGYIVVDDYYAYEGCMAAVDNFFSNRRSEIIFVDKVDASVIIARK